MRSVQAGERHEEDLGLLLVSVSARLSRLYGRVLSRLDAPLTFRQHRLLQNRVMNVDVPSHGEEGINQRWRHDEIADS